MTEPRIVSLLASATEIVAALGFRDRLVGRSHECDFPPGLDGLPPLTAPKFSLDGTSRQIDDRVKDLVHNGLAVYRVDEDLLRELAPDVIVTQDQCQVCAASLADVEAAVCDWTGTRVRIVSHNPNSLDDLMRDFRATAAALGVPDRGDALVADVAGRIAAVTDRTRGLPDKPRVAAIEWIDPLFAAGNWMPELIEAAGGINLFGRAGEHSGEIDWAPIRDADPEIILVIPCGFGMAEIERDMPVIEALPGWADMKAVRTGRVCIADGHQYFNRPGPRLADSAEMLGEMLHPEVFDFGYEGRTWRVWAR
jgi:iron complex transport system substrate-binding protein